MKKTKSCLMQVIIIIFLANAFITTAYANQITKPDEPVMNITQTVDTTAYLDRLLYYAYQKIGYKMNVTIEGMVSAMVSANTGSADGFMANVAGVDKTYKNLVQVPEPISNVRFVAYARTDETTSVGDWASFSGTKVGYMEQKPYIDNHMPKDAMITRCPTNEEVFEKLVAGEVDFVVVPFVGGSRILEIEGAKDIGVVEELPTYTYVNKVHSNLVPKLSDALHEMNHDGTTEKIMSGEMTFNTSKNKIVLLVSSYSGETKWEQTIIDELHESFSNNVPFEIYGMNLNAIRYGDNESHQQMMSGMVHKGFVDKNLDLVVATDNEALDFVKKFYNITFDGTPVVFCGINGFTPQDLKGFEKDMTGVTEAIAAKETVEQMIAMFPKTKKLFVINDFTESGNKWRTDIQSQLSSFEDTLDIEYNEDIPIEDLFAKIKSLPKDSLILTGFYFRDSNFKSFMQEDIRKQLYKQATAPIFGLFPGSIGYGQVGGKYASAEQQARKTHTMMENVIMEKSIDNSPIIMESSDENKWIFDNRVLNKWKINKSVLPKDAEIINKKLNIFEKNPLLASLVGLLMIFMGALVYVTRSQLRYEKELLKTQESLVTTDELLAQDRALTEAAEQLDAIVSAVPVAFIVSIEGVVVLVNKYYKEQVGMSVGSNATDFYAEASGRDEVIKRLNEDGKATGMTCRARTASGDIKTLYGNFNLVDHNGKTGINFWGVDITERERKTLLLKRLQSELQSVLDTLPLGVYIYEQEHNKPLYVNLVYAQILGFNSEISGPISEFMEDGESIEFEWQFYKKGNESVVTRVFSSKIVYNDQNAVLSIVKDISADKKQTLLLQEIAEQEKEANKIKNNFIINMSHEIRTPMNAVIGLTEIALTKNYEKEAAETFRKVNTSAKHLLNIINDVLDFSKIEAETLELMEDDFVLTDTLANACLVASQRLGTKRVEMNLDIDVNLPNVLHGDKTRFWQIFKNLLDNSAKFTNTGRIILSATSKNYKKGDEQVWLELVVSDTGLGMSPEHLEKIFTPFEQFHQNATNVSTGTGLGMSIAKQIIELMGGTIAVESEVNVGTTTTITLPFKVVEKEATIKNSIKSGGLAKCRILAADDDEISLGIIESLLKVLDCEVTCVKSGEEALVAVTKSIKEKNPYQIILLDYFMGMKNGIEVAEQLGESVKNQAKLLMVSAYTTQLNASQISDAGFDDIIEKPFSPTDFVQKIRNSLNIKQSDTVVAKSNTYSRAKVMVVEDNIINQEVACSMLEIFGINASITNNGQEAIDLLEKQEFDLIFMDIHMPVMDGHIATQTIRASKKPYANVPIVAMTANVVKEEINKCINEGMNGHISKPIDLNNLSSQLALCLAHCKDTEESQQV